MLAAATFAANVSAQGTAITSNKFGDNWYIPKGENAFEDYRENDPGVYTLRTEKGPHHLLMGFHRYKKALDIRGMSV